MINFRQTCQWKKRERTEIISEKGEVTSDSTDIPRITRDYYEQLSDNKMGNMEEMDKSLGRYNLPRLNQEEIENRTRPISSPEMETVI